MFLRGCCSVSPWGSLLSWTQPISGNEFYLRGLPGPSAHCVFFSLHVSFETKGQQQQKIKSPAVPFLEVFCLIFNGASEFGQTTNYTLTAPLVSDLSLSAQSEQLSKGKASFKTSSFLSKMPLFPGSSCPAPDVSASLPGFQAHHICGFQLSQQVSYPSFISVEGLPDIQSWRMTS